MSAWLPPTLVHVRNGMWELENRRGFSAMKSLLNISDNYKIVRRFSFPDHHRYGPGDVASITGAIKANPTAVVITTEKDAQRIVDVPSVPKELKERLFKIPIEVRFLSDLEKEVFDSTLLGFIG